MKTMQRLLNGGLGLLTIALLHGAGCQHVPSTESPSDTDGGDKTQANGNGQPNAEEPRRNGAAADASQTAAAAGTNEERLAHIESLLQEGENEQARKALDKLLQSREGNSRRIDALKRLLTKSPGGDSAATRATDCAIQEVHDRMGLPPNYGKTTVISRRSPEVDTAPGPMEQLMNREVTLHLDEASVASIVFKLTEIEGLNIIADRALTEEEGAGSGELTLHVAGVPLKEVLSYIARNMGLTFHLGQKVIWVTEAQEQEPQGPRLETRIFPLRSGFVPGGTDSSGGTGDGSMGGSGLFDEGGGSSVEASSSGAEDDELATALEMSLSGGPEKAFFKIFNKRNMLLVRDTRERLQTVEQLLQEFDRVPKQVLIEARFLTIRQDDLFQIGVDIEEFSKSADTDEKSVLQKLTGSSTFPGFSESGGLNMTISGILGDNEYQAVLRALEQTNSARTLSAPRLTLLNSQSARIRRGNNVFYWEEWEAVVGDQYYAEGAEQETSTTNTQPVGAPTEIQEGVTMDVNASVGSEGKTILLKVAPSIRSIERWNRYGTANDPGGTGTADDNGNDDVRTTYHLPEVSESSIQTSVAVNSGETVVMGGILDNSVERDLKKVPILGDIPLFGVLFRQRSRTVEPRHLLIFVTAKVLSPSGKFVQYQPADAE